MSVEFLNGLVNSGVPSLASIATNRDDIDLIEVNGDINELDEDADEFQIIYTIKGKWLFDITKDENSIPTDAAERGNRLLRVFEVSDGLAQAMETATHVKIGDEKYSINRPDSTPPTLHNPVWQIYCDQMFI